MIEPEPTDAGPRFAARGYRPGRLGLVAFVGAVVALVIGAVLIGASLSRGALTATATATAAPSNAATSSPAGPPVTSAEPTPANATAALAAAGRSVDAGIAAGEIDADTATELRQNLEELSKRLEQGKEAKVAEVAGELLKNIDEWAQDGRIFPARAVELRALLQPLAGRQAA